MCWTWRGEQTGVRTSDVPAAGLVSQLYEEVFARLQPSRLVVTGGPGSGKTVAMLDLMFAALHSREIAAGGERRGIPVPVWLPLVSWNPAVQSLREWVADTVCCQSKGFGSSRGRALVEQLFDEGALLLLLDGLDEMPEGLRTEALLGLSQGNPGGFVLTSGSDAYRALAGRLPLTGVVELDPILAQVAADYLHIEDRVPADQARWQPLAQHLIADPDGSLAQSLSTPAVLTMTRQAYAAWNTDPAEILAVGTVGPDEVSTFLADRFLDTAYPDVQVRERATRWLGWLARHMASRSRGGARCRDLLPGTEPGVGLWMPAWLLVVLIASAYVGSMRGLGTGTLGSLVLGVAQGLALGAAASLAFFATVTTLPVVRAWRAGGPVLDLRVVTVTLLFQSRGRVLLGLLVREAILRRVMSRTVFGYRFRSAVLQSRLAERSAPSGAAAKSRRSR